MKQRDDTFDLMKGVGIILMVVGHILISGVINSYIYSFHMPMFFIISGYFYKPQNISAYFKKDFSRLVIPYLFVGAVLIVYSGIEAIYYKSSEPVIGRVVSIFWGDPVVSNRFGYVLPVLGSVWFLLALFWCRQLFNFLYLKAGKYLIVVVLIISYSAIFLYKKIDVPFSTLQACAAIVFYYTGYIVKKYNLLEKVNSYIGAIIFVLWMALGWLGNLNMALCYYSFGLIPDVAIALSGTYVLYTICKHLVPKVKFVKDHLLLWGRYSLVALCFSSIFASIFTWRLQDFILVVYEKLGLQPIGDSVPVIFISLLFAYIFILIVPGTGWGRKVFSL